MQQPDQQASDPQMRAQACSEAPSMQGLNASPEDYSMQAQQASPAEAPAMHDQRISPAEAPAMQAQQASPLMMPPEAAQHEEEITASISKTEAAQHEREVATAFIPQEEGKSSEPWVPCTESGDPSMQAQKDSPEDPTMQAQAGIPASDPSMHAQKDSSPLMTLLEPALHEEEAAASFNLQDATSSEPRRAIQGPICDEANGGSASSYGRDMGVDRMEAQLDGGMYAASEEDRTAASDHGDARPELRQGVPEVMVASDHGETRPEVQQGMPELTAASDHGDTRLELRRGAGIPGLLASGPRSTVRLDMRQGSYAALAVSGEEEDYMAFDEPEAGLDARQGMPAAAGEEEEDYMACDERADAWPSEDEEVRRTFVLGAELMQGAPRSSRGISTAGG